MIPFQSTKTKLNIFDSPTPDMSVLANPQGLINITCDKFNYSQWGSGICVESSIANYGSYTSTNGARATVTFIGTKVHILAHKEEFGGPANIWIDDEIVGTPNFYSTTNEATIIFTSNDLDYGEHTLTIEHNGTDSQYVIFASIYVDPLPKESRFTLDLDDASEFYGSWNKNATTSPPTFSCDDENAYLVFKFFGTKFWITGVRGKDEGDFQLNIDDQERIMIDEKQESGFAQNNMPVLLYQSSDLECAEHKIVISRTNYKISLVNVMYTTYPYDIIATEPATGNYNDTQYLNDNRISSTKFTATTTGDQSGHPIENAFDSSKDTFWASSIASNDTFQSTIEFEFAELTTIEAIVIFPVFSTYHDSTGNITRSYDGFPTSLRVYGSTDDSTYKLHSVFIGTPASTEINELFQFAFKRAITCNKLKLEFTEVTLDVSFGNEYTAACGELYLIPSSEQTPIITRASTPLPTPLGYPMITLVNYSDEGYWSSYRINDRSNWIVTANSEQTTETANEGPVTNIIDGQRETIWHSKYNEVQAGSHDDRLQETDPFQFTIDLGQETTFRAFSYTPRQNHAASGSQNGIFLHYEFYVADTKEELDTKIQERNYISNGDFDYMSQVSSTDLTSLVVYPEPKIGRFIALLSVNHDGHATSSISIPKNINKLGSCFNDNPDLIAVYYFGSENPSYDSSIFSATSVKYVYVLPEYNDDDFCGLPILPFPGTNITYSIESDELIISGTGAMYDYSPNCNNTAPWYENASIIRSVTIEEGITTIGSYSFYMFSNFETITIPQSVISIRPCAFSNCTKMTSFQIPETITILERGLFVGCSKLVSINIHENVSQIESKVFSRCTSIETILLPEGLERLGSYAFYECSKLKSISIPENITIIEEYLFSGCSMLISVIFEGNITQIQSFSFYYCDHLQNISFPKSLTEIGGFSFYNCDSLLSISIPEKVTKIAIDLFSSTNSLQTVEFLGNVTSIEWGAFHYCSSLLSIDFPPSVETIGMSAFSQCHSLTYFEFPEKVTNVNHTVLRNCKNLISVSFLGNVTTIDYEAFYFCPKN
ncbi:hypothetical protein M9Y10_042915 [Tritrichomonas musculus]|uniref:F5/8 type C domain-containing protein n=1 Tax=Tritrichomonas musculus TaxID=1915356 RepID=A0ABR2JYI7_9EUKA